jgi:hypothetical protein
MKLDMTRYFNSSNPLPDGFGHLSVSYTGRYNDLLFDAGSVDQSLNYVFQVMPSAEVPTTAKIFCLWSIEGDTSTMISIWNYASEEQDATLTLYYHGGEYKVPLHLAPRQTYNLDLMTLVKSRVPDADGNLIPDNITSGSATLVGPKGELDQITVVTSASTYNVRNATCFPICIDCGGVSAVTVPNYSVFKGSTVQATATIVTETGNEQLTSGDWSSDNTNIATVNTSGVVTGVNAGSTSIDSPLVNAPPAGQHCYQQGDIVCPYYPWIGTGTVTVQPPAPVNFTITQGATLPDGTLTWTYSFQSSTGNLSDLSACQVGETVYYPGSADPYAWPYPMVSSTHNPSAIYGPATSGGFNDRNLPPDSYQKPYNTSSFSATQRLQWECSNYQSGAYQRFVPDITITRQIQLNGSTWQYKITKSSASAIVNLP